MLHQVLDEIQSSAGPVSIGELCRRLDVEHSLMESMVTFWVRKGRIQRQDLTASSQVCSGSAGPLCKFCSETQHCPSNETD